MLAAAAGAGGYWIWRAGEQNEWLAKAKARHLAWTQEPEARPASSYWHVSFLGGVVKPLGDSADSHDLGLAALYLRFRGQEPGRAASWVPEDLFDPGELEGFVPDAVVREEDRLTLIEFAGTYKKERLQKLHASCERTSLPYELW